MDMKARHPTLGSLVRSLRARNVTAENCDEATVLGVCSSTDESLLDSLMSLHGDVIPETPPKLAEPPRPPVKLAKNRKR